MRLPTPRQWTAIVLAVVALPALTYTAWPLIPFLAALLPEVLPLERLLWGLLFAAVLVTAVVLGRSSIRASPLWLGWLILLAWSVAIASVTGIVLIVWLILGFPGLEAVPQLSPRDLDAIATRAFAIVAGLGGVALLVISYRRQRTTEADAVRAEAANTRAELAAEREIAKLFTETFDSASDKLGSEHAAVRLAGVHALARLADEAPEGREDLVQMVIDVLCAYLRMPYSPKPEAPSEHPGRPVLSSVSSTAAVDLSLLAGAVHDGVQHEKNQAAQEEHRKRVLEFESFQQVRHTIIRVIGDRLRKDTRWRGKNYDFTGVVFDGGDLSKAHFTGGTVSFMEARFIGGEVNFSGASFIGGTVNFDGASFIGGTVNFFEARFIGGTVNFGGARFMGGTVNFGGARFADGEVNFGGARFIGGGVHFGGVRFTGGTVHFQRARFTGGKVSFFGARFTGGRVHFIGARFTGGRVHFIGARFIGGEVDFRDVEGERPRALPSHLWSSAEGAGAEPGMP